MAKPSQRSEIQRKSRDTTGLKSTSFYLLPDERELLDRVAKARGITKKDAIIQGLKALENPGNQPTDAELLEMLRVRLAMGAALIGE